MEPSDLILNHKAEFSGFVIEHGRFEIKDGHGLLRTLNSTEIKLILGAVIVYA